MIIDYLSCFTLLISFVTLCKEEKRHVGITYPKHCVCLYVYMQVSAWLGVWRLVMVFLSHSTLCFLKQGLSLNLEFICSGGQLGSQQAPRISLSLPPQCWYDRHTVLHQLFTCALGSPSSTPHCPCLATTLGLLHLPSFPKGCGLRL